MNQARIAIFASGNGSNAERIIRHFIGHHRVAVSMVLSNNPEASVLQRASGLNVKTAIFNKEQFRDTGEVLAWLTKEKITHIVLAGFLWLVPSQLIDAFPGKIINIHPALLPRHGGKGMYGLKVHEAVHALGDKETGITIHLVNTRYDEGKVLFQERCPVFASDTAETIAERVHDLEYRHYPSVIEKWITESQSATA
jgi:phosphoribosylglycinamide formyltransferase-1